MIVELVAAAAVWLLAINLAGGALFLRDKLAAVRGDWRVPERVLLILAGLGATPAVFALTRLIRHKTRKQPFRTLLFAIAALQLFAVAAVAIAVLRS